MTHSVFNDLYIFIYGAKVFHSTGGALDRMNFWSAIPVQCFERCAKVSQVILHEKMGISSKKPDSISRQRLCCGTICNLCRPLLFNDALTDE